MSVYIVIWVEDFDLAKKANVICQETYDMEANSRAKYMLVYDCPKVLYSEEFRSSKYTF